MKAIVEVRLEVLTGQNEEEIKSHIKFLLNYRSAFYKVEVLSIDVKKDKIGK